MESLKFVSEPSNDQLCPICVEPLIQPFLTDCGHYLCYTCRGRLLASGKDECPVCREPNGAKDARLNKHLQRQVNSLKVRCQHHEVGCQWVGELMYLKEHLDPLFRRCGFILLVCPLGCGERVRSSAMEEHIRSYCSKRPYVCEHCGYYNKCDIVTEKHYPLCELFPVECPNKCSIENLKRNQFEIHIEEQCPLQVIQCPFTSAGCTVQLPRREMEEHEHTAVYQHLRMMMSLLNSKQEHKPLTPSLAANDSQYLFTLPPVEFTITDFLKLKESNTEWVSPPFYTHPHGYKVCMVVYPNGIEYGKGSHVSVFVGLLKGEYDDQLVWPLELDATIELLNWREDMGHHERTVTINSEYYRVTKNGIKLSPGGIQFILHSLLSYNNTSNTEYLQNNSLRLRLTAAINHSPPVVVPAPSWQDPNNVSQSVCEFTLTEFSKRKQSNNLFYCSPPFFTHHHGYKMCLSVCSNGAGSSKSTHVSVHVFIMAGDNDDHLQWPFTGDIVIELLNWREDNRHHSVTLSSFGFDKVAEGTVGNNEGSAISHSLLSYNPTTNTEYLHNDFLRLRVKQVAVYSTPLLLKTPSWQDPHYVSQSVCEFTLNEFSKRKQFDNEFYSSPFYTHQHGYKMCLGVYSNGDCSGKGTHVSVYVQLMAGDNDDQLQWPFVGDINIMLLNWREDKGHYKVNLPIDAASALNRVLQGKYGTSWGYSQFISHSSLPYNRSTNKEYLQDDCLRFRVNMVTKCPSDYL